MSKPYIPSRRDFLKDGGALVVGFSLAGQLQDVFAQEAAATKPLALTSVDTFLAIDSMGAVTVYSGKVDLGTGVRTALAQIAAEELDVPFSSRHNRAGRHRANARSGADIRQPLDPDRRHADSQRCGRGARALCSIWR